MYGEDVNDTGAIGPLVEALREADGVGTRGGVSVEARRQGITLRNVSSGQALVRCERLARLIAADARLNDVVAVIHHEDADAIDPAFSDLAARTEDAMQQAGIPQPVSAACSFELESWLWLWPKAIEKLFPKTLGGVRRTGQMVGLVNNAKEALRRDIEQASSRAHRYDETDASRLARLVKSSPDIEVSNLDCSNRSFNRFRTKVEALVL